MGELRVCNCGQVIRSSKQGKCADCRSKIYRKGKEPKKVKLRLKDSDSGYSFAYGVRSSEDERNTIRGYRLVRDGELGGGFSTGGIGIGQ